MSGATPPLNDGDETAAEECADPFEGDTGEPPPAPSLPFTAQSPQRALYEEAFRAAHKYPDALMLVMQGVRKGLKRGKEAAREAGGAQS